VIVLDLAAKNESPSAVKVLLPGSYGNMHGWFVSNRTLPPDLPRTVARSAKMIFLARSMVHMVEARYMLNFTSVRRCSFLFTSDSSLFKFVQKCTPYPLHFEQLVEQQKILNRVGFEPTPFRTSDSDTYPKDITLSWRLRPLGHLSIESG
jgi:hypothetical protein